MLSATDSAILACDLGTTGAKVSLVAFDGCVLASHYTRYKTYYPFPDWAEQNPQDWISSFVDGTKIVLEKSSLPPTNISAVAFSGHMHGCVPVDRCGSPLTDRAILWADRRSSEEARNAIARFGWERFYSLTGAGLEVSLYPLAKINWIRTHAEDVYKKAHKFLGTKDVLVAWLTGLLVTDPSEASDTGMFDLSQRCWARDLLDTADIDLAKLPDVLPSTTVVGGITHSSAAATGLLEGTPVVLGAGDVTCAALGAGMVADGQAYCCLGSASWVAFASQQPLMDSDTRPFVLCHAVPDMYLSQLATYSAGVVVEWMLDEIFSDGDGSSGSSVTYDDLMSLAASSPPGANELLCLPYLRPGGAPSYDPSERGILYGMQLSHQRADVVRAVLEGITYSIRKLVYTFDKQRVSDLPLLRLIGGGANSPFWAQLIADMIAKPVETLEVKQEANTVGAAVIGMVAEAVYDTFQQAADACVRSEQIAEPSTQIQSDYQAIIHRYQRLDDEMRNLQGRLM